MKLGEFFKSNSFKCIVVLLVIALVCGTLLALANDLFAVSDEEMFARSMSKIYDGDAKTLIDVTDDAKTYSSYGYDAVILDAQTSPDGKTWLVQSKGSKCGYSDGSVVLWLNMSVEGTLVTKINKVIVDSYDSSQTLIGNISDEFLRSYCNDGIVSGGGHFYNKKMTSSPVEGDALVVSLGATYTSRAVDVAVNGALDFVREQLSSGGAV